MTTPTARLLADIERGGEFTVALTFAEGKAIREALATLAAVMTDNPGHASFCRTIAEKIRFAAITEPDATRGPGLAVRDDELRTILLRLVRHHMIMWQRAMSNRTSPPTPDDLAYRDWLLRIDAAVRSPCTTEAGRDIMTEHCLREAVDLGDGRDGDDCPIFGGRRTVDERGIE